MTTRYMPKMIQGTSSADHLSYEIEEQLPANGYSSRAAAQRGWQSACRRADQIRARQGYSRVDRPRCEVVTIQ